MRERWYRGRGVTVFAAADGTARLRAVAQCFGRSSIHSQLTRPKICSMKINADSVDILLRGFKSSIQMVSASP